MRLEERFGGPHGFINVYVTADTQHASLGTCFPARSNADAMADYQQTGAALRRIGIWKVYLKGGTSK